MLLILLGVGASVGHAAELAPPVLLDCPEVAYPAGLDAGPQQVRLTIELDTAGRVVRADLADDQPEDAFAAVALGAVRRCSFTPATEDGRPVPVSLPFGWAFGAPPVSIRGVVRAMGTGAPVGGLGLGLGDRRVTTGPDGTFEVRNLAPGAYPVEVLGLDWLRPRPEVLTLAADQRLEVELRVRPRTHADDELVAVYDPHGAVRPESLTRQEARAIPGSLGDPVRALHSRPGLARTPFDAGWLLVRGGDFDDTGVYLDGVPLPMLYHLGGFTSVLHPEMTEQVSFWPGLQPARYSATSGAVDLEPRAIGSQARAQAGMNTVFAHAFAESPTPWGGVAVAARRSWLDGVLALVLDPEAARVAPRFLDGQVHARVGEVDILAIGLSDSFDAPSSTSTADLVTVTQDALQLQAATVVDVGRSSLRVAPWIARHVRSIEADTGELERLAETFPGMRIELLGPSSGPLQALVGIQAEHRWFTVTQGFLGRSQRTVPALIADPYGRLATGDRVLLETELRVDNALVSGQPARSALSPRGRIRWQATEHLSVAAEAGRVHTLPQGTLMVGVPEGAYLPLERADSVASGMRWDSGAFSAGLDVYHRRLSRVPLVERDGSLVAGFGAARGVETHGRWRRGAVELSGLLQLSESLRWEALDEPAFRAVLDQPVRAELLGVVSLPHRWTLSSRGRATSGFSRRDGLPDRALDLLLQRELAIDLPASAPRLPAFYALDVKLAHRVPFRASALDLWLDVQNLTNRRVPEPLITGFGASLPEYGVGLPILPIFGIEVTWWRQPR